MPFSHRLSRVLLSVAILAALVLAGYEADRHGAVSWLVHRGHAFVSTVVHIWS